eukprot:1178358-Prorocentrum_minimum.AAC.2
MMLGEFADTSDDLFDPNVANGLLVISAYLYFYSFMCIVFLVMLNFLLAIIVDAFVDVKNAKEEGEQLRLIILFNDELVDLLSAPPTFYVETSCLAKAPAHVNINPLVFCGQSSMFQELYKYLQNTVQYMVKKEHGLRRIEQELNTLQNKMTSIKMQSICDPSDSPTPKQAWAGPSFSKDEVEIKELAVVMMDETYLVKVAPGARVSGVKHLVTVRVHLSRSRLTPTLQNERFQLLGRCKRLATRISNVYYTKREHGYFVFICLYLDSMNQRLLGKVLKLEEEDDTVIPDAFAEKVVNHFGRAIPVSELEVPILQTSETEQIKEAVEAHTRKIAKKVDLLESRAQLMEKKVDEILVLLRSIAPWGAHQEGVRRASLRDDSSWVPKDYS